ncbi:hypothetical protein [Aquipuribacter sp. SD81]|uniref:hypothetical protein n=1 Tax=Aquipuribacter sp. SD81 TaxID=3127703 RepID=UPI003017531E
MDPLLARALLLAAVMAAVVVAGLVVRARERRVRRRDLAPTTAAVSLPDLAAGTLDRPAGTVATVVVVGTRACSDCARTLAALRAALGARPGVTVAHVLAERVPDLVERLDVRTAPTVLLADAAGVVVVSHPGAVDADRVAAALDVLAAGRRPSLDAAPPATRSAA